MDNHRKGVILIFLSTIGLIAAALPHIQELAENEQRFVHRLNMFIS